MKSSFKSKFNNFYQKFFYFFIVIPFLICCQSNYKSTGESPASEEITTNSDDDVVEVISEGMNFKLPSEITSGWTTFRYRNNSNDTHFFVLEKLPAGKTIEDSKREIVPVFQEAMDLINEGNAEEGFAAFGKLPEWFGKVQFLGGPGLVSPGNVGETAVNLESGNYVIECYVKMPDGKFHSYMGMMEGISVTEEKNGKMEPEATTQVNISSHNGIEFTENISSGNHIVAVHFEDQIVHEHFVGHDVHLVKLEDTADLKNLNNWMNWADPDAFKTPAPQGVEFLGGAQELPAGMTAYFNVNLEPGNYALISEVPDPANKNMLKTFTVVTEEISNN